MGKGASDKLADRLLYSAGHRCACGYGFAYDPAGKGSRRYVPTHCPSGHEYTPENSRFKKNGSRMCRECHRLDSRARRAAARESSSQAGERL